MSGKNYVYDEELEKEGEIIEKNIEGTKVRFTDGSMRFYDRFDTWFVSNLFKPGYKYLKKRETVKSDLWDLDY